MRFYKHLNISCCYTLPPTGHSKQEMDTMMPDDNMIGGTPINALTPGSPIALQNLPTMEPKKPQQGYLQRPDLNLPNNLNEHPGGARGYHQTSPGGGVNSNRGGPSYIPQTNGNPGGAPFLQNGGGQGGQGGLQQQVPVTRGGVSLLSNISQYVDLSDTDVYLSVFVAIVFYLGQNKILTKSLFEKFGDSSQYVAMLIVVVITFVANKYVGIFSKSCN